MKKQGKAPKQVMLGFKKGGAPKTNLGGQRPGKAGKSVG